MGTFKLQVPARLMFTQVLSAGHRRLLAWNARSLRLSSPASVSPSVAPNVIDGARRFETRARDSALVTEFKTRLRQTEDLIGKLGYNLRELQETK